MKTFIWDEYAIEEDEALLQHGTLTGGFQVHNHDFSELVIILGGRGCHIIGSKNYPLRQGDIYVIAGSCTHGFGQTENLEFANVLFHPEKIVSEEIKRTMSGYKALFEIEPTYRIDKDFSARLKASPAQLREIFGIFEQIEALTGERTSENRIMVKILINLLVAKLSMFYGENAEGTASHISKLSGALAYIDNNLGENLDTSLLAGAANYSPRHFTRIFKEILNETPQNYILKKRLGNAARLICLGNMTISEAALLSGFSDSSYFARVFKNKYGITPSEYKKHHGI